MAIKTKLHTEPLSATAGQTIINIDAISLFDLDETAIIDLFKSEGALLFRGFESNIEVFTEFTNRFSQNFLDYTGGVFNRRAINGDVTVLSVNDFNHEIKLHGEMYYQKNIPHLLWFFCAHPASQNGETLICDGKRFFDELSQSLKELFNQKKLKYRGHLDREAWQKRYKTDDLNLVKQICKETDVHLTIHADESIEIHYICSAIHSSRDASYRVFINSLLPIKSMAPSSVSFEDGSEVDDVIMSELHEIAAKLTAEIRWQQGDILMLDNTRMMHGRRAFTDTKRDIYLRLCSPSFSY